MTPPPFDAEALRALGGVWSYDYQQRSRVIELPADTLPVPRAAVVALFEAIDPRVLKVAVLAGGDVSQAYSRDVLNPPWGGFTDEANVIRH